MLFTTPGESEWQVHFNPTLGMNGTGFFADGQFTPVDIPATNVLSVTVPSGSVEEEVDPRHEGCE